MEAAAFNEQVRNSLHEINFKIMQMMNQNLVPFGITPSQMSVIVNLDKHGEMNISKLSKLVKALPRFEVDVRQGGQSNMKHFFVRDKERK